LNRDFESFYVEKKALRVEIELFLADAMLLMKNLRKDKEE